MRTPTRRAVMACAASRPCCCLRVVSRSRKKSARRRAAKSSNGSRVISTERHSPKRARPNSLRGLGSFESSRVGPELVVSREFVLRFEPADFAAPEDVEAGRDGVRLVERGNAEVHRFRLMIDLHQEWRSAFAAEFPVAEA